MSAIQALLPFQACLPPVDVTLRHYEHNRAHSK